jgi:hypothetical protein
VTNILIGYANYVGSATLAGGSWASGNPLANLKDSRLALTARSSNAATGSTIITADLGAAKRVRVVGLVNHNLSIGATVTVEGSSSSGFSPVGVTSGAVLAWPTGTVAADTTYPRPTVGVALDATYRYWRVSISNAGNPAGYVQLGRLFIADGWRPSINMQSGATLGFETDTAVERSLGGAEFFGVRPLRRVMRFGLPPLPVAEAYGYGFEIMRRAGVHEEVFLIPDESDTANRHRRDFMGRLRVLNALEHPYGDSATAAFEVAELL